MLITMIVLALGVAGPEWATFEPGGKDFRVEMPGKPQPLDRVLKRASGTARLTAAEVRVGGASYAVQVTENRGKVDPKTLDDGIRRFAKGRQATLGTIREVAVGDNPGREFELTEKAGDQEWRSRLRWVVSGNRLFMLAVGAPPGGAIPGDADRFLGSLTIGVVGPLPPAPAPQPQVARTEPAKPAPAPEAVAGAAGAAKAASGSDEAGETEPATGDEAKPAARAEGRKPAKVVIGPMPRGVKFPKEEDLVDLGRSYLRDREGFRMTGPVGAVLVGVRVHTADKFGGPKIAGVQAIYRLGNKTFLGQIAGQADGPATTVVAKPGYAVGGLAWHAGLLVDGFRVVFMKVDGDRLDPDDSYNSPWLGDENGGGPGEVMSQGDLVVGLQGRAGDAIFALGLTARK